MECGTIGALSLAKTGAYLIRFKVLTAICQDSQESALADSPTLRSKVPQQYLGHFADHSFFCIMHDI